MSRHKPKGADTDYRKWTYKHFKDEYDKICEDISKEQAQYTSDNKNPITYVLLSNVLVRLLGKASMSWRRDLLNDEKCIAAKEKYALLESHDSRQINKLITYSLNDRLHQFGASKVLDMVAKPRFSQEDYSLNNKEAIADKITIDIKTTGKLK